MEVRHGNSTKQFESNPEKRVKEKLKGNEENALNHTVWAVFLQVSVLLLRCLGSLAGVFIPLSSSQANLGNSYFSQASSCR